MSALIELTGVKTHFPTRIAHKRKEGETVLTRLIHTVSSRLVQVKAVDGVDLSIEEGETMGLVGESGCGKSTLGRTILRLVDPTSGSIRFDGNELTTLSTEDMRQMRRHLQMVFQDPYASLNPRMRVGAIVGEPLAIFSREATRKQRDDEVAALLERVGLSADVSRRYPHEFSGGQRQRIGIARALALKPRFVVCDEPVSALDVSIQAQIINLLKRLKRDNKLTYLFISHDLNVVRHLCDRVAVMYLGKLVELAPVKPLYDSPAHPYTEALLSAVPSHRPDQRKKRILLTGDVPSPMNPPAGCAFHPRCPRPDKPERCFRESPTLRTLSDGRMVACHLANDGENTRTD